MHVCNMYGTVACTNRGGSFTAYLPLGSQPTVFQFPRLFEDDTIRSRPISL